jgi:acetoin utilization protein AcuB
MLLNAYIESALDTNYPSFADDAIVAEVFSSMRKGHFESAPVLHAGKVTAMVTIMDLLDATASKKKSGLRLLDLQLQQTESIGLHGHLFDHFARIMAFSGRVIPVAFDDGTYAGTIEKSFILQKFAEVFHLGEEYMTLEIDVPSSGLKLSEVIAAIEKNDATVLSSGLYHSAPEGSGVVVTFRIQTHDWFRLVKNMEKYGYLIHYSSPLSREGEDELREKALEFIRFMDM